MNTASRVALTILWVVVESYLALFLLAGAGPGILLMVLFLLGVVALPAIWWYPRWLPRRMTEQTFKPPKMRIWTDPETGEEMFENYGIPDLVTAVMLVASEAVQTELMDPEAFTDLANELTSSLILMERSEGGPGKYKKARRRVARMMESTLQDQDQDQDE